MTSKKKVSASMGGAAEAAKLDKTTKAEALGAKKVHVVEAPKAKAAAKKPAEPKSPAPAITPASVLAAARAFHKETAGACDMEAIADDDNGYGSRLRVLKALLGTDKVVVKDAEPARLKKALLAAVGAKTAGELALKCTAMVKAADKKNAAEAKADKERSERELRRAMREAPIHDGKPILPAPKRLSKKQRAVKDAAERAAVAREMRLAQEDEARAGIALPRPGAAVSVDLEAICLLEDPSNGIVLMRLEKPNSQGAICVYNNGSRVAAGVVPTEVLNTLRSKSTDDLIRDVNQLLRPITAGVVVTPVAEHHLTAVLAHCKESIEMANKKAAETAAKTKKFAAPASASKKAIKADKPAKAAASAAGDARKSSLFRLLNDTKAAWSAFTTQKGEIVAAFVKLGAVGKTAAGVTRAQLIAALPQVPDKNISFYLSKWQPAGIVEKLPAAE
jgi:hypothetical protein